MSAKRKPVLVVTLPTSKYEFFLLNPGEVFEGFGGSRQGLLVKKTASLVVRHYAGGAQLDTEYDLAEGRGAGMWEWVQKFVDAGTPIVVKQEDAA